MPILKKPGLDGTSPSTYRPTSNLSVISVPLERLIVHQLMTYIDANNLLRTSVEVTLLKLPSSAFDTRD